MLYVIVGAVLISLQQGEIQRCRLSSCIKMIPCECQMHVKAFTGYKKSFYRLFIPFRASGERQNGAPPCWARACPKPCCYCWVLSTQRCPARTQCLSWWAGSGHPHRSVSGRQHTWSTPDGKPCPAHAWSSQMLWSSSHRKHRDRPDRKAWMDNKM